MCREGSEWRFSDRERNSRCRGILSLLGIFVSMRGEVMRTAENTNTLPNFRLYTPTIPKSFKIDCFYHLYPQFGVLTHEMLSFLRSQHLLTRPEIPPCWEEKSSNSTEHSHLPHRNNRSEILLRLRAIKAAFTPPVWILWAEL